MEKLDTTGWSKEKIEAYEQNLSKRKMEIEMEAFLDELLKKYSKN
jgi:hypothetical protein